MTGVLQVPVFAGVDAAVLGQLEAEATRLEFAAGAVIVREGDAGGGMMILHEGEVEVVKRLGGPDEVVLARLGQGAFFGEMCIVEPMPRAASVRALTAVTAYELKAMALLRIFNRAPEQFAIVALNLARDLARRLRALDEAYAALAG